MARYVIKLGSSIVAQDDGELRADVIERICAEAAARHAAGDDVVLVTSGAIARGMRVMGLAVRPRAIEDLQAASAVGQGKLYRVYDELLRAHGITSAQVLLTFFDMSARTHYLNARGTLGKLLDWRVLPVINENDTTTTDEISFGDNDFLAAQVAMLVGADLLVLLTDVEGLFTASPHTDPTARLVPAVTDFAALGDLAIGHTTSPLGTGGMRSKVVAAEMATAGGIETVICSGLRDGRAERGARRRGRRARASAPARRATRRSSSGCATPSRRAGRSSSTPARRGRCATAARRCCRSGSPRCAAPSTPATRCRSRTARSSSARESATTPPTSSARSRA